MLSAPAQPQDPRPCLSLGAVPGLRGITGWSLPGRVGRDGGNGVPVKPHGGQGSWVSELPHTLDCAACGTKVTMPGVVWETTGTALPSTASLCFLWASCSLWFLSSSEHMAEAFSSRACRRQATVFWRMNSRRDSELWRGPRAPRGLGQGRGVRTSFSFSGAFRRAPWLGLGQASLAPKGVRRGPLP